MYFVKAQPAAGMALRYHGKIRGEKKGTTNCLLGFELCTLQWRS
jgi:hypothetical protein